MNCDQALESLLPFSLGSLDASEAPDLQAHLLSCVPCETRRLRLLELFARTGPAVSSSPGTWQKILERDLKAASKIKPSFAVDESIGSPLETEGFQSYGAKFGAKKKAPAKSRLSTLRRRMLIGLAVVGLLATAQAIQFWKEDQDKRLKAARTRDLRAMTRVFGGELARYFALSKKAQVPNDKTAAARERWTRSMGKLILLEIANTQGISPLQLELPAHRKALNPEQADVLVVLTYSWRNAAGVPRKGDPVWRSWTEFPKDWEKQARRQGKDMQILEESCDAQFIDLETGAFLGRMRYRIEGRRSWDLMRDQQLAERLARATPWPKR